MAAEAPATSHGQRWVPMSGWDRAFASNLAATGRDLRLTRAMSCVAAELGRFHLEEGDLPPEQLLQFIVGACGALPLRVGVQMLKGALPSSRVRDEATLSRWEAQIGPGLVSKIPPEATEAGFWYGRRGKEALALTAFGTLEAEVLPFELAPDARNEVAIEGEVQAAVDYVSGYINVGRFAVARCLVDPSLRRPRFRFICPAAPTDDQIWIELLSAPVRKVLARPFARVLVRRDRSKPILFEATQGTPPSGARGDFAPALVEALNQTRREAGLSGVQLALAESARATALAGVYFGALLGEPPRPEEAETIGRGLSAGWEVGPGMIREGTFVSELVEHTPDPAVWLRTALIWPMGREGLLAPEIEEVAIGRALLGEGQAVGAIVSGYRFYRSDDHSADVRTLLGRIRAGRTRLGLPEPRRLADLDPVMRAALAEVKAEKVSPFDALGGVLARGTQLHAQSAQGSAG